MREACSAHAASVVSKVTASRFLTETDALRLDTGVRPYCGSRVSGELPYIIEQIARKDRPILMGRIRSTRIGTKKSLGRDQKNPHGGIFKSPGRNFEISRWKRKILHVGVK